MAKVGLVRTADFELKNIKVGSEMLANQLNL